MTATAASGTTGRRTGRWAGSACTGIAAAIIAATGIAEHVSQEVSGVCSTASVIAGIIARAVTITAVNFYPFAAGGVRRICIQIKPSGTAVNWSFGRNHNNT